MGHEKVLGSVGERLAHSPNAAAIGRDEAITGGYVGGNSDAGLRQLSPELEEAGLVCGDTRSGVLLRILVPIIRQPLLAVGGLAFITLYRDVSISILLYTPATTPSSVALLGIFDEGSITGAAAYSVVITIISAATVALVIWASRSRTA